MPSRISVLRTALLSFTLLITPACAQTSAEQARVVGEKPIRTLKDIRNEGVVRQRVRQLFHQTFRPDRDLIG